MYGLALFVLLGFNSGYLNASALSEDKPAPAAQADDSEPETKTLELPPGCRAVGVPLAERAPENAGPGRRVDLLLITPEKTSVVFANVLRLAAD